jgi:hypothetical protein
MVSKTYPGMQFCRQDNRIVRIAPKRWRARPPEQECCASCNPVKILGAAKEHVALLLAEPPFVLGQDNRIDKMLSGSREHRLARKGYPVYPVILSTSSIFAVGFLLRLGEFARGAARGEQDGEAGH